MAVAFAFEPQHEAQKRREPEPHEGDGEIVLKHFRHSA
ncbi:hypothetical protein HMPREF9718_04610 [Sphingobium yanoikuyae ATCC 51230]|uniref:Uncharacterized protein n=1 Tax=Sphingobium yanoikuyae ATCC 51230 TaxID=883163 RepID=K9D2M5_SPHYA|nr:hypothetical protein HMPREF9718_04610 [Sphingobium yanoikuyae ATCC 51230]